MKKDSKTVKQRKELDALTQRITDIYSGAGAREWTEEEEWPSAEELSFIIPAMQEIFNIEGVPNFIWKPHNLKSFETPSAIAKQLFAHGVRAKN